MTCQTEATSQMPMLNIEQTKAEVSSRYWPTANGRSARGSRDGFVVSVITAPLRRAHRVPATRISHCHSDRRQPSF
jgi:hypothetical protein